MGLTHESTGRRAVDAGLLVTKQHSGDLIVALAGNPNVGKSTVFNALTGLNQHTGNWPGKTVSTAQGICTRDGRRYILVDLPGCYSLLAHSTEEEVARDFLCFAGPDAVAVVCDATCLERNLNLVLQTLEITGRAVVCVNLMDEARRKGVQVDLETLSRRLGVPVVATAARNGDGLEELLRMVARQARQSQRPAVAVTYPQAVEEAVRLLSGAVRAACGERIPARWAALRLMDTDDSLLRSLDAYLGFSLTATSPVQQALSEARAILAEAGIRHVQDVIVSSLVATAEDIAAQTVRRTESPSARRDRRLDRILTSRRTGIPVMLLLLAVVFWLTISGANYPSQLLSQGLGWVQVKLNWSLVWLGIPDLPRDLLINGVYTVLAWVVAVMLPPMAIFFPLFTLLEDLGYLPRIAFNLDKYFQKCRACGKQALTMCMGFGCNAAGVVGCRIIDSPRERLIAILTNTFVPCNGRFPTLIAILTMFFVTAQSPALDAILPTLGLTLLVLLGVFMTLLTSRLLSSTLLQGVPSSFTLELPPYRRPQIGRVIVRSIYDRTLFVLGRAVAVAAPAGLVIWVLANVTLGDMTLLARFAAGLDPLGRLLGMDGVILLAFILGFPANEIVIPILLMAYTATGHLVEYESLASLKLLLTANGWTTVTAVCVMLFSLMHWPCSTTLLTVYRETKSVKWTALSFLLPTACGAAVCFAVATAARLLGLG